jgi:hypothetical protein
VLIIVCLSAPIISAATIMKNFKSWTLSLRQRHLHPNTNMTGSSIIQGVFPLFNCCTVIPKKPKSLTFDTKIAIGYNSFGDLHTITGLVHYFLPAGQGTLKGNVIYDVCGKITAIQADAPVGPGVSLMDYDIEVEGLAVCTCIYNCVSILETHINSFMQFLTGTPVPATVTIGGAVSISFLL